MAEGQADIAGACPGGGGGVDRISGLPDHLLHSILLLIPGGTAADAARTSVLSRRWRHVWAHLPELALRYREASYARAHRHVDAALAAYAAPTVRRLEITVPYGSPHLTAGRLSSWLRFAALRLAGGGALRLSAPHDVPDGDTEELLLPVWETVTSISLDFLFSSRTLRFRLLPGGAAAFTALAFLKIRNARVGGRELEHVLSSRCPGLTELVLERVSLREGDDDVVLSIRSASLQRLQMDSGDFAGLLRVATPELQVLTLHCIHGDAYIAAPKLSELYWGEPFYDPSRHRFAETTARHLRRMMVATGSPTMALMERFDIVGELDMTLYV
nr:unnamed protein product [Digitaria exilis]